MFRQNIKGFMISIPVLGYFIRIASNTVHLPKLHDQLLEKQDHTYQLLIELKKTADRLGLEFNQLAKDVEDIYLIQDELQGQFSRLETTLKLKAETGSFPQSNDNDLFADDHLVDSFYLNFEDRFRGSESIIKKRLEEYLSYFSNSKLNFNKTPVLDLGCGRGEFLRILKDHKIDAIGLDINLDMVERSKNKSLKTVQGDALTYLQDADSQSYGAITGFHLVEHIPFNTLLRIFKAAHRDLTSGGFVIFETPNPENIVVGSNTFYMDPSHLHPLPPIMLAFALEICGFKKVEIKRLHPDTEQKIKGLDPKLSNLLFGPRDYSVIGYK